MPPFARWKSKILLAVFILNGVFLFSSGAKNAEAYHDAASYQKLATGTLLSTDWNNLPNDFVTTWTNNRMEGTLGIGTNAPASGLSVNGPVTANSFCLGGNCLSSWDGMGGGAFWDGSLSGNVWNKNTGNLGIGTTAPGAKLDISGSLKSTSATTFNLLGGNGNALVMTDNNGTIYSTNTAAFLSSGSLWSGVKDGNIWNGNAGAGNVGIGITNPWAKLFVNSSGSRTLYTTGVWDVTGSSSIYDNTLLTTITPSTNEVTGKDYVGLKSSLIIGNTNYTFQSGDQARSFYMDAEYQGTQTFPDLRAAFTDVYNTNSGTVTNAYNLVNQMRNTGTGTIGSAFGVDSRNPINSGGGTIGNYYGFYYRDATTPTNAYAFYSGQNSGTGKRYGLYMAGTAPNYFNGSVGIGTTAPGALLEISTTGTANNFKLNATGGGVPGISIAVDGTIKGYWAAARDAGQYFTDAAPGDMAFRSESNKILFGQGAGNSTMAVNGTNVGIGTTTPGTKLDVSGSLRGTSATTFSLLGGNGNAVVMADNTGTLYSTSTASFLVPIITANGLWTGTKNGNIWNGDAGVGNVGIGTTNPGAKLDIYSPNDYANLRLMSSTTAAFMQMWGVGSWPTGITYGANDGSNKSWLLGMRNTSGSEAYQFWAEYYNGSGSWIQPIKLFPSGNVVMNAGNVGIGTTNPIMKLQVVGNTYVNGGSLYIDSGNYLQWGDSRQGMYGTNSTGLMFNAGNTERMRIADGGNVGIGTTTPSTKLDVLGSLRGSSATTFSLLGNNGNAVVMTDNTGTIYSTSTASFFGANSLWSGTKNGNIWNGDAGVGNVGIGTTNPQVKLHVVGTGSDTLMQIGDYFNMRADGVMNWGGSSMAYGVLSWDTGKVMIGGKAGIDYSLLAGGSEKMRITSAGNVGIGTTTPANNLVVSSANGTTLQVDGSGGIGTQPKILLSSRTNGYTASEINYDYYGSYASSTGSVGHGLNFVSGRTAPFSNFWFRNSSNNVGVAFTDPYYPSSNLGSLGNMNVLVGGSVGIGTTTPSTKLDVLGSLRGSSATTFSLLGNNGNAVVMADNTGTIYSTSTASFFSANSLWSGSKNGNIWNGDAGVGNVGIGTTNPEAQMHIAANDFTTSVMDSAAGTWWYGNYDYFRRSRGTLASRAAVQSGDLIVNHNYQGYDGSSWQTGAGFQVKVDGAVTSGIVPMQFYLENRGADGTWRQNLVIRSTGNVGIGTTNPGAPLDVYKTSDSYIRIRDGAGASFGFQLEQNGTLANIWNFENGPMTFATNNSERMRITAAGNVGIGTTTPSTKLDVLGSLRGSSATTFSLLGNNGNAVVMTDNTGTIYSTSTASFFGANSLWSGTKNGNIWNGDAGAGNVGIGTTNPTHLLQISSSTLVTNSIDQAQVYIQNTRNTGSGHASIVLDKGRDSDSATFGFLSAGLRQWEAGIIDGNNFVIRDGHGSNNLKPFTIEQNAPDNSFYLSAAGNVGIGTATPPGKLSVNSAVTGTVTGATMYNMLDLQANGGNHYKIYGSDSDDSRGLVVSTPNTAFRVDVGTRLGDALLFGSGNSGGGNNTFFSVSRTAATGGQVQLDAFNSGVGGADLLLNSRFGSGNVGINTTSPSTKLDVLGSLRGSSATTFSMLGNNGNAVVMTDNTGTIYSTSTASFFGANSLWSGTKNGNIWNGDSGVGNVGIGTTNPNSKLMITDANKVPNGYVTNANLSIITTDAAATDKGGSILLGGENAQSQTPFGFGLIKGAKESGGSWGGYLSFFTTKNDSGMYEGMRLNSNGNLGIGTTAPSQKLDVNGVVKASKIWAGSNADYGQLLWLDGGASDAVGRLTSASASTYMDLTASQSTFNSKNAGFRFAVDAAWKGYVGINGADGYKMQFGVNSPLIGTNAAMTIDQSRNVGIGTTSPSTKLDVLGSLRGSSATTFSLLGNNGNAVVMTDNTGTIYSTSTASFFSANSLWSGTKNGNIWNGDAGAGNVGIGTTNPIFPLMVSSSSSDYIYATIQNTHAVGAGVGSGFGSTDLTGALKQGFRFEADNSGQMTIFNSANGPIVFSTGSLLSNITKKMSLSTAGGLSLGSGYSANDSGANNMIIQGSLGIGTTSPGTKLDVAGSLRGTSATTFSLLGNNGNAVVMTDNTGTIYSTSTASFFGANSLWSGTKDGDIWNGNSGAGNVGIGTTTPSTKLEVTGVGTFLGSTIIKNASVDNAFNITNGTTAASHGIANFSFANSGSGYNDYVFKGANSRLAFENTNDSAAGSFFMSYNTFQFAYNNYNVFGLTQAGKVGSLVPSTNANPTWRNLLDDGSGNGYFSGNLGIGGVAVSDLHVKKVTDGSVAARVENDSATTNAEAALVVNAYGNSWAWSMGSAAKNSNRLDLLQDWNSAKTPRLSVMLGGNVGIGTTTPSTKLDVLGSLRGSSATTFSLLGNNGNAVVMTDNNGTIYSTSTASFFGANSLWSGTKNGNIWNGDAGVGNVGIGTTNPTAQLQISGSSAPSLTDGNSNIRLEWGTGNAGDTGAQITFAQDWNNPSDGKTRTGAIRGIKTYGKGSFGGGLQLLYQPNNGNPMLAGVTLDHNGNVGIGTTNPGAKLYVAGDAVINSTLNTPNLWINTTGTGDLLSLNKNTVRIAGFDNSGNITTNGTIVTSGAGNSSISGNLGIGTTTPSTKLDVLGSLRGSSATTFSMLGNNGNAIVMTDNNGNLYSATTSTFFSANSLWGGTKNGNIWNGDAGVGNVGIGTTNPTQSLNVVSGISEIRAGSGASALTPTLSVINNNATGKAAGLFAGTTYSGFDFSTDNSGYFVIGGIAKSAFGNNTVAVGDTAFLTIGNTGNVGIGTTTPAAKLDVVGNGNVRGNLFANYFGLNNANGGQISYLNGRTDLYGGSGASLSYWNGSAITNGLVMDGSGNVSIGTTSPSTKLDVFGSLRGSSATTFSLLGNNGNAIVMTDNNGVLYSTSTASFVSFLSTSNLWSGNKNGNIWNGDAGAGNVGIGTTNPGAKLEVSGGMAIFRKSSTSANVEFRDDSTDGYAAFDLFSNGVKGGTFALSGTAAGFLPGAFWLGPRNGNPLYFTTQNTPVVRMSILDNGNVGIGTTSPLSTLYVQGNAGVANMFTLIDRGGNTAVNVDNYGQLTANHGFSINGNNGYSGSGVLEISSSAGTQIPLAIKANASQSNPLLTITSNGGSQGNLFAIDKSGNVGIATTTPGTKLDVNGTFRTSGVNTLSSLAGYGNAIVMTDNTGNIYATTSGMVNGSGAANYVARWISTSTLSTGVIYDNGTNVGISTTSPAYKLDVNGNFRNSGITNHSMLGGSNNMTVMTDGTGSLWTADMWLPNGTTTYKLNGNVGIGTTNPTHQLQISTSTLITNSIDQAQVYIQNTRNTGSGHASIVLDKGRDSDSATFGFLSAGLRQWEAGIIDGNNFVIRDGHGSNNLKPFTIEQNAPDNSFYLSAAGNVGIGTATPPGKLSVNSAVTGTVTGATMYNMLDLQANGGNHYKIYGSDSDDSRGLVVSTPNTAFRVDVGTRLGDALLFGSGNSGGGNNTFFSVSRTAATGGKVQLDAFNSGVGGADLLLNSRFGSGNVGIGTTSTPGAQLDVLQSFRAYSATLLGIANGTTSVVMADPTGIIYATNASSFINANNLDLWSGSKSGNIWNANSGNVGIGTTNPSNKLEIKYTSTTSDTTLASAYGLRISNSGWQASQISGIEFWNGGAKTVPTSRIISQMNGNGAGGENLHFQTQSSSSNNPNPNQPTTKFSILANGNVGIGTTNPGVKLDVVGDIRIPNNSAIYSYDNASHPAPLFSFNTSNQLVVGGWEGNYVSDTIIKGGNGNVYLDFSQGNNANFIVRKVSGVTPTELMRMTTAGNLGIGTTNPLKKLQITDSLSTSSPLNTDASLFIYNSDTTANNLASIGFNTGYNGGGNQPIAKISAQTTSAGSKLYFLTSNNYTAGVTTNAMTIDQSGNVGIATTTPGRTLDVNGTFRTSGANTLSSLAGYGNAIVMTDPNGNLYATTSGMVNGSGSANYVARWISTSTLSTGVIYDNGASVGISTTSPAYKLDVNGNFRNSGITNHSMLGGSNNMTVMTDGTGSLWTADMWLPNGTTTYKLNGNVGIGTTAPTGNLQVHSSSGTNPIIKISDQDVTNPFTTLESDTKVAGSISTISSVSGGLLHTGYSANAGVPGLVFRGLIGSATPTVTIPALAFRAGKLSGTTYANMGATETAFQFQNISADVNYLTILGNGNVGIGVINPAVRLTVAGNGTGTAMIGDLWGSGGYTGISLNNNASYNFLSSPTDASLYINRPTGANMYFRLNNINQMTLDTSGNLGIGLAPTGVQLDVFHSFRANSATISMLGTATSSIVMADKDGNLYSSPSGVPTSSLPYLPLAGGTMTGDILMSPGTNIAGVNTLSVNKINATTIDPLYSINGINYSTFASSIAGGVKEEYVGKADLRKKVGQEYEAVIDFSKLEEGDDLWVWKQVVEYNRNGVDVFITPYGGLARTYYLIENNKLIFRADHPTEISYRLVGKRFDWRNWPTRALDQKATGFKVW